MDCKLSKIMRSWMCLNTAVKLVFACCVASQAPAVVSPEAANLIGTSLPQIRSFGKA